MHRKYVIIGNSAAAVGAVEAIRRNDRNGSIVIFSKESQSTYSRPLISYYNQGKVGRESIYFRPDDFYEKNDCDFRPGTSVFKIDIHSCTITTDSGSDEKYDRLLIATGSEPVVPPFPGLDTVSNVRTYTSFDDALALEELISSGLSRVLIVGAGLIGLKCAEGISKKADVTCVDLSDKVLSSILDDVSSDLISDHIRSNGIKLVLGNAVKAFSGNKAELADGSRIDFDVLVIASGVRPCASLFKNAGGLTGKGIIIDDHCRTSAENVFAAGDCVESVDMSTGKYKVMALLPNAYMQGECAGSNMSDTECVFNKAIPMNALTLFGLHILTTGSYTGEVSDDSEGNDIRRFYHSDNRLNGYILINNIDKAGIYTSMIRDRVPLDTIDFGLVRKAPGLMAFGRVYRDKTLGGKS
ncbi:MAG: FAD-dependent oxidoreductase [Eubacteriales bacterium]|nr:FAD-dependent oxidoreductase [Eubacteriales bacterium]